MEHFDVCVIGSGSGNSIIDERFAGKRMRAEGVLGDLLGHARGLDRIDARRRLAVDP